MQIPLTSTTVWRMWVVALGCLLLLACAPQPEVQIPNPTGKHTGNHALYVVSHGWHTGLILPLNCLTVRLPGLMEGFEQPSLKGCTPERGEPAWVEVGWGDTGFYQAQEITLALALQAFFASRGAVLHLVRPEASAMSGAMGDTSPSPRDYYAASEVLEMRISDQELDAVCRFVALSFQRAPHADGIKNFQEAEQDGALIPLGKGLYGDSRFYEAKGRYHALHTCNTWTAKGLASAGINIQPHCTLTSSGVMRAARNSIRAVS